MALTSKGLTNGGQTAHYRFEYDDSLRGGLEPARTNAVIAACETDFSLMTNWFRGTQLDVDFQIPVNITQNSGGAAWLLFVHSLTVTINPGGGDASLIRYLLVSEMVEQFMRAHNRGWFGAGTEGSQGEGLSRFLAASFLALNGLGNPPHDPVDFTNSNLWLGSARTDFIDSNATKDDGPDEVTGCCLLFIYYLSAQLRFPIDEIIAAGASTLGGVFRNLTGEVTAKPFARFKRLVDSYFPGVSTITSGNLDNPFPLKKLRATPGEILWHNSVTNETQIWFWDGHRVIGRATVVDDANKPAIVGPPWTIVGNGHFNLTGNADIVWHNSQTNETQIWFMNGNKIADRETVIDEHGKSIFVGLPWSIVGTGGPDGDAESEIVWHNSQSNETLIWFMDRNQIKRRATVIASQNGQPLFVGSPWHIVGVGDFTENGVPDIVWHNTSSNETQIWFVGEGATFNTVTSRGTVLGEDGKPALVGPPWQIVATGDSVIGDDREILWHNSSSNETQIWFTSRNNVVGRAPVLGEDGQPVLVGAPWGIVGSSFVAPAVLGIS